jgi:putative membrane protein
MIERYSDHAANERTFLAWVRTAIAVMAFGFLVERFDLFVEIAGKSLASRKLTAGGLTLANIAGLMLIVLGCATLLLAIVRFRKTALDIDAPEEWPNSGARMDVTLAGLLALLGAAMFVYLCYTMISQV